MSACHAALSILTEKHLASLSGWTLHNECMPLFVAVLIVTWSAGQCCHVKCFLFMDGLGSHCVGRFMGYSRTLTASFVIEY